MLRDRYYTWSTKWGPLVLIGGLTLVLEGSRLKIEDKQVSGRWQVQIFVYFSFGDMIQFNECFSNGLESDSEWAVSTNLLSEIRFGNLFRTQIGRNQELPTSLEPSCLNCYGEINQRGQGTTSSGPVSIATLSTSSMLQLFMRGIHSHKLKGPELRWWNYLTGKLTCQLKITIVK